MKIIREDAESTTLEMSMEEAQEIAAQLDKNAKIVGAAGAELRKLLPDPVPSAGGTPRYEYDEPEDLR
ncbi:hypothetical protein HFU84_10640 [Acidithiobacillus sp. CV18-2]|uniref:Uncharacterized protein n=1 Tax=Igneacidithiobacillus copahuensis TaxID=2724909 RepID=A0AAE2YPR6_9PROT|nr:hypothetical protein [Igneacidithiobacillus copahuensis]MBU2755547.1 hypothetical protein [Acidithiobacillus sp. CV18-3]MBU2757782.1 hypothetical protein [Acidithiobacillus sp. BN09-2]MBU2777953.1 hypothetical protein [Acidithiobacillus sp. CV18-2]MBU2797879.1 hypothetical protein [Acidithiobacillus sp. VAN18-2]MBU2799275.1 hypothetical protein [Acidithiobacillus sp. VAN18-4]MDD3759372.1 hypothetical protein [Acidithiobacillus sp.]UTV80666.1 hypothetical protein MQE22_11710 [Acidithiobaci